MGRIGRTIALGLAALLALGHTSAAWAQAGGGGPPPVGVAKPVTKSIFEWDEYTGRFEATERVEIRARVSGYLESIHFRDGEMVEKGQLLFVLDQRPFEAALEQAEADVARAESSLELAERELRRGRQLIETRAISQQLLDERRNQRDIASSELRSARAAVRIAELNRDFARIEAPVAGRASNARVDVGNLVSATSGESALLTTIVSLDPIYFVFDASEAEYLKYMRLNQQGTRTSSREINNPVFVRLMDEQEWVHEGVMDFIDNEIGEASGTIRGRAILANPELVLVPGLFGHLRLLASGEHEAQLIPDAAILSDQARKIVLVVGEDGTVEARPITLGPMVDGLRVVRDGLSADDRIVVEGLQRARPGGKVTPQETTIAAEKTAAAPPAAAH